MSKDLIANDEIAAAQAIPVGTVQWRVFNGKNKLAPYLKTVQNTTSKEK